MAGVWRGILGNRFATIGFWPLLAGLAISAFSTLALSVVQAAMTYRERVQTYPELGEFWSIVPGWAMYFYAVVSALLFFAFVFAVVPMTAMMIRRNHDRWYDFLLALPAAWLIVSFAAWGFPSSQWQMANRAGHLWQILQGTGWIVCAIVAPHCLAVMAVIRARMRLPNGKGTIT